MKNLSILLSLIPTILASPTTHRPLTIQQILRSVPAEQKDPNGTLSVSSGAGLLQSLDGEGRTLSSRALARDELDVIQALENDRALSEAMVMMMMMMMKKRRHEDTTEGAGDGHGDRDGERDGDGEGQGGEVVKYPGGSCSPAVACTSSETCGRGECSDCVQIGWFPIRFCQ